MKMVRFLIGSLLVAGMLAVAPAAFAEEGDGGGGQRGPRHQDPGPGGSGGGGRAVLEPDMRRQHLE